MPPASFWAPPTRWASPASILPATAWCACRRRSATACMFVRPKPVGAGESGAIDIDADLGALVARSRGAQAGDLSDLLGRPRRAAHQLEVRHRHLPRGLSHPASAPEDDRAVLHRQCRHLRRRRPARPHVRGAHLDRRRAAGARGRAQLPPARHLDLPALPQHHPDLAGRPYRDLARLPRPRRCQPLRCRDDDLQARRTATGPTPTGRRTATSPSAR